MPKRETAEGRGLLSGELACPTDCVPASEILPRPRLFLDGNALGGEPSVMNAFQVQNQSIRAAFVLTSLWVSERFGQKAAE